MGKNKGPYKAEFEVGTSVLIANREFLENFLHDWKLHHPLETQQLNYHSQVATVEAVGFYHGGNELYKLEGVPGIWHERCLKALAPNL